MNPHSIPWNDLHQVFQACSGYDLDRLSSYPLRILSEWSQGGIDGWTFLTEFKLDRPEYLNIGRCMIRLLAITKGA